LSADEEDFLLCNKDKVGEMEMVRIRSNKEREDINKKVVPEELRGRIDQVETKMVKKFQKWQVGFLVTFFVPIASLPVQLLSDFVIL
jgi:hypothetical protein